MKNFIKLIQQVHAERYSVVMKRIAAKKIPVTFLSLMPIAQAVELTKTFRTPGFNITCLVTVDNTAPPEGLDFDVISLKDAAQIYPTPEYVLTADNTSARVAIKNFPASKVLSLNKNNSEQVYEAFMTHLDELREVYESLIDEESKRTFRGYWLGNIANRLGDIVYSNAAHYLLNGFIPARGAVAFDCGVFDGGTATVFAEMGYKVYGFEIDKVNYQRSLKIAEEKNFVVENMGLGSYKHIARYNLAGHSGNKLIANGAETVPVTTIDAYAREHDLPSVDFIKMDVEGAELDILKGAKTSIARYKPILALSAYHKLDDLWTLMNFVKSIRPDYEFALRQSYETPEEEPANFRGGVDYLIALGLEPHSKWFNECVLFAR